MPQSHDYLCAVERGLRCPAERRPAIIEELRAHLQDRVEALVAQGEDEPNAQRQAIHEMGTAWLLAVRLSVANGWTLPAHVCREIWAAGVGIQIVFALQTVRAGPHVWDYGEREGGRLPGADSWMFAWGPYLLFALLLTAFPAFGFAMGRLVRGWLWALVPGMGSFFFVLREVLLEHQPFSLADPRLEAIVFFAAGTAFVAAAVQGSRKGSPRLTWIAWASAALLVGCSMAWFVALPYVGLASVLALAAHFRDLWRELIVGGFVYGLCLTPPWLLWYAARMIDRHARGRLTGSGA